MNDEAHIGEIVEGVESVPNKVPAERVSGTAGGVAGTEREVTHPRAIACVWPIL